MIGRKTGDPGKLCVCVKGTWQMRLAARCHPAFLSAAYAQLQPQQLLPQPPRPAPQVQSQPQLAPVSPSLALQSSAEDHSMPLGPVTPALPPQCPTAHLHKPGSSQQCHLPPADTGSQNGHPEGVSHAPQRRFQHTSAVILQLQPASPVVSRLISRHKEQWQGEGGGGHIVQVVQHS